MQTRTELVIRLEDWATGVTRSLKNGPYQLWADDIGREVLLFLFEQETRGLPVPDWQGALEGEIRRVANRIARSFRSRHMAALDEKAVFIKETEVDDPLESHRKPRSIALRDEFSGRQTEAMTRVCGTESKVTQEKLAEAAGLPLRTFKRTVKRLREHCSEA